jgi:hypothetical protein
MVHAVAKIGFGKGTNDLYNRYEPGLDTPVMIEVNHVMQGPSILSGVRFVPHQECCEIYNSR